MTSEPIRLLLQQFHRLAAPGAGGLTDAQLLERFVADKDEAAFEVLVWRHGPLVYRVCRRLLHRREDVEDAFQATFLALVRKAPAIRNRAAVGGWLHQVAHRVALRARAARRHAEPYPDVDIAAPAEEDPLHLRDLRAVLDEEIRRLPAKYRDAVVLCYLSGLPTEEVGRQLGCPRGTVLSRLAWARERLRERLTRRGLVLPAGVLAAWLAQEGASASAPALLIGSTMRAALGLAWGKAAAAGVVSARAAALMEGALRSMFLTKLKTTAALALLVVLVGLGAGRWEGRQVTAQAFPDRQPEAAARAQPNLDRQREAAAPAGAEVRTRVALLNMSYVIKNYDEFKKLQETVKKQTTFYQDRLDVSRARIDRWSKELAIPDLAAATKVGLEMDIRAERRKMEDDMEEAKRQVAKLSDDQTVAMYRKVQEAVERYARAYDIDLVLHYNDATPDDKDHYSPVNVTRKMQAGSFTPLYWKAGMDISKAVVAMLNKAHRAGAPDRDELPRRH
jgi:RNA polymerase sigma factor (sigma-70 family)